MIEPVIPTYPSNRKIGVEMEVDPGCNGPRVSVDVTGWEAKGDGSLSHNGREFVMNPPKKLPEAHAVIKDLCSKLVDIKVHKSGSIHVHVQVADYTHDDAYHLVKLYTHFQSVIDSLVGRSRHNNHFCPAYPKSITKSGLISKFRLNDSACNRSFAKGARQFSVANLAMMRCSTPSHRTIEFRQGSVSKKAICVIGWATFLVCLTDMALYVDTTTLSRPTLPHLLDLIKAHELRVGSKGVADWVQWRHDYLNAEPTEEMIQLLMTKVGKKCGIYSVSQALNTNLAVAKALLVEATNRGLVTQLPGKKVWCLAYDNRATEDLAHLEAVEEAILNAPPAPPPVPPTSTPTA
jgi:hypothetical protein